MVRRSRLEGCVMLALWSGGAWLAVQACRPAVAQGLPGWRDGLIVACLFATGLAALQGWRRAPQARLRWDGRQWFWSDAGPEVAGELAVRLDLQRRVLARWQSRTGSVAWIWLTIRGADGRWHALRCALHAAQQSPDPVTLAAEARKP